MHGGRFAEIVRAPDNAFAPSLDTASASDETCTFAVPRPSDLRV